MMTEPENFQGSDSQKAEEDSLSAPSPSLEHDPSQTTESAGLPEEPTLSEGNEDPTLTEGGAAPPSPMEHLPDELASLTQEDVGKIYDETLRNIKEGDIIKGRVIQLERDSVLVDVGYKSEGFIALHEFPHQGRDLKVGDEVDVFLETAEDNEGQVVLSKEKANRIKVWDVISKAHDRDEVVEGEVIARIRGGLTVDIGLRAFLPGSQVDLRPVRNLDQYIGKKLQMKIIKLNRKRSNIVLSRRILLEAERAELKKQTLETLQEGQVLEGIVKNLTDYGAFIDLGGIDGLLHITDMSWGRVGHPSELFNISDRVKVVVLKFDRDRERVSLGHKQITHDPWQEVDKKYPAKTRITGKVTSITDYGAFVELEQGVEGLVHISEMSWSRRVRHPSKIVNVSDVVEAVVLNVDKESKRISLGMKQIEDNPWDTIKDKYPVGSKVSGRVRNLTDFGAFLALDEGIDGLIHISDMSWTQRIKHPSEILKKGQPIEAVVLNVDAENERLSLGLKQIAEDPWTHIEDFHKVGEDIKAVIVKITNFGAFAALEDGLEGLIHVSELDVGKVVRPEDIVAVGEDYMVKLIKIDSEARKLGLSIRAYIEEHGEPPEWEERRRKRKADEPAARETEKTAPLDVSAEPEGVPVEVKEVEEETSPAGEGEAVVPESVPAEPEAASSETGEESAPGVEDEREAPVGLNAQSEEAPSETKEEPPPVAEDAEEEEGNRP